MNSQPSFHYLLDWNFDQAAEKQLRNALEDGLDPNLTDSQTGEALIHVAARRRRLQAVQWLAQSGANVDQKNSCGKTAFVHCLRRGFSEISDYLKTRGAEIFLEPADRFAVAIIQGRLDEAKEILDEFPFVVKTGNPEEDRLLADVAGRAEYGALEFLIESGADLEAKALDGGGPLHQAAWFGQIQNVNRLVEAGASLDRFDNDHQSSAIGWAVHGAKYSGGAMDRLEVYQQIVSRLLEAGSALKYPQFLLDSDPKPSRSYLERLRSDAPKEILALLPDGA